MVHARLSGSALQPAAARPILQVRTDGPASRADKAAVLDKAPPDLQSWTRYFLDTEIPVLGETAAALDALREDEDAVDATAIAEIVEADPLMSLKLLAHVARNRPSRVQTDIESVTAAVLLMGVPPFLRKFAGQATVEQQLAGHPEALTGLQRVLARSRRAAVFAIGFAVLRKDGEAQAIHLATLLHDFTEALLWCHAPRLALTIRSMQLEDPGLRSVTAQRSVLNVTLSDLEQALMRAWKLPELLVRITDDSRENEARVRNVTLALQLARHTQHGWDNPALPDDFEAIGALLNVTPLAAHRKSLALDT